MKILVTGAAGFIGSHLTESLLKKDHTVFGLDNFDPFYDKSIKLKNISGFKDHPDFKFHECDITHSADLENVFSQAGGFDLVVHLAAKAGVRPSILSPADYISTNISGTYNILKNIEKFGVTNFVFASSSSVYGNNLTVPFKETDITEHPISPYAFTKKACELMIHSYYSLLPALKVTSLRFFTVYGPRQRPDLAIYKFLKKIHEGSAIDLYGNGETARDYTFISDTVSGIEAAIANITQSRELKSYDIFNIGNSSPVKLIELIKAIEEVTGKKAKLNHLPEQPGDVELTYADISKAKEQLNYNPSCSLREGLSEFNNWILKQ